MDVKYSDTFQEMLKTAGLLRNFNAVGMDDAFKNILNKSIQKTQSVHIVAEGSSRFFPGDNLLHLSMTKDKAPFIRSLNGMQACDDSYQHSNATVILISNSGETKELMTLGRRLQANGHKNVFAVTAHAGSSLQNLCGMEKTHILSCGKEKGVAATMSVVEQMLALQECVLGITPSQGACQDTANYLEHILTKMPVSAQVIDRLSKADAIYFASGIQNGVGKELSLKFSETVKRGVYIDGTTIVHGYQETMDKNSCVVLIDLPSVYEDKFKISLQDQAGLDVIAINTAETTFPTLTVPKVDESLAGVLQLAVGWRLMAEIAQANNVDIDSPKLATKVGYQDTHNK